MITSDSEEDNDELQNEQEPKGKRQVVQSDAV